MPIFIIEHLEPELFPWCLIEYKNISRIIGKKNLWFTNIKKRNISKLRKYGKVTEKSIKSLNLKNICILDPEAKFTLHPEEAKKFSYFIFGGILGSNPRKSRTKKELRIKGIRRNLTKEQFSTDNAIYVVKQILKGRRIEDLKFQKGIEIKINKLESIILPYKYVLIKNKPLISKQLINYLKNKKEF